MDSRPQSHAAHESLRVALLAGLVQSVVIAVGWYFLYHVTHERIAEGVEDLIIESNERMAITILESIGDLHPDIRFGDEHWERVQEIIERAEFASGGFACILDDEGAILCHPEIRDNPGLREINLAEHMFRPEGGSADVPLSEVEGAEVTSGQMRFFFDGKHYIATRPMKETGLRLLVHQPVSGLTAAGNHLTRGMLLQATVVGALVVFLTTFSAFLIHRRHHSAMLRLNAGLEGRVLERTRELERALRRAELAVRARDEFLANMSHELRTPMNGVLGAVGLMRDMGLRPEQEELAGTVERSATDLLELMTDMLEYSRLVSREFVREEREVDLRKVVERTVERVSDRVKEKGLSLSTWIAPDVPDRVLADGKRIGQALLILVDNAVKFTNEGDVRVQVERTEAGDASRLRFSVRDSGRGISPEAREHVFEAFRQEDGSFMREIGGAGLGLALSREIVTRLGGSIAVESEVGVGSTFRFELPLRETQSPPSRAA